MNPSDNMGRTDFTKDTKDNEKASKKTVTNIRKDNKTKVTINKFSTEQDKTRETLKTMEDTMLKLRSNSKGHPQ